jgi:hypothetical protein
MPAPTEFEFDLELPRVDTSADGPTYRAGIKVQYPDGARPEASFFAKHIRIVITGDRAVVYLHGDTPARSIAIGLVARPAA